jgi:hypothetical protein
MFDSLFELLNYLYMYTAHSYILYFVLNPLTTRNEMCSTWASVKKVFANSIV